jgi:hypothetical protein
MEEAKLTMHELTEEERAVEELHAAIKHKADADAALWRVVMAYQNEVFYTSSGLPFSYKVKQGKNGNYTGELIVSRKEGSKTLTKSSVQLAFHKVLNEMQYVEEIDSRGEKCTTWIPSQYKGPKAIGQIFGISYIYSLFWRWGLITVPEKVEKRFL